VVRAARLAKDVLIAQGYEVVPFEFTMEELEMSRDIFMGLVASGYLASMMDNLHKEGEAPMSIYRNIAQLVNSPWYM